MKRDPDNHQELFALIMTAILITALGLAALARSHSGDGLGIVTFTARGL